MSDKTIRALERAYRRERDEIINDLVMPWEKKMRKISERYTHYLARIDALRGAAPEDQDGAA